MYYRGIKQTPENVAKEKKTRVAGIYRGIKHDAITVKSSTTVYPQMVSWCQTCIRSNIKN